MKQGSMPAKVIGPILRRAQVVSMDLDAKSLNATWVSSGNRGDHGPGIALPSFKNDVLPELYTV